MTLTATVPPMLAFPTVVRAVDRRSPSFVRLTLGGASLRRFHRGGPLGPRDTRVKLLLGLDGSGEVPVPDLDEGWYAAWRSRDPRERGVLRTYTVRRVHGMEVDPLLDLDVVVHEPGRGPVGPGCAFALLARPGDRVTVLGPNAASEAYGGLEWRPPAPDPRRPPRILLVADETGVPAVASILEGLPDGYRGQVVLEVPSSADVEPLTCAADLTLTWLARGSSPRGVRLLARVAEVLDREPATTADPAGDAAGSMPSVPPGSEDLLWEVAQPIVQPESAGLYAWVAGEASVVRDVRRLLVGEHGVDRRQVTFMGYWREGCAEGA